MDKFNSTTEGYEQAKAWLIEIGQWEYISTHGQSVDGYSIVATANTMWESFKQFEI
jgi:hypothetical protein